MLKKWNQFLFESNEETEKLTYEQKLDKLTFKKNDGKSYINGYSKFYGMTPTGFLDSLKK